MGQEEEYEELMYFTFTGGTVIKFPNVELGPSFTSSYCCLYRVVSASQSVSPACHTWLVGSDAVVIWTRYDGRRKRRNRRNSVSLVA